MGYLLAAAACLALLLFYPPLLMGSIMVFAVLALAMISTRKLDWAAISARLARPQVGAV